MNSETMVTWEVLRELGFLPDEHVVPSDIRPGLSLDFGNFKLSASQLMSMTSFREVVFCTGVMVTPRTVAQVQFEMPTRIGSREQCAAWIAFHLDSQLGERREGFVPERPVEWLTEGRSHRNKLPWVADLAEYETRPHCAVQRDWLRVALKALREIVATVESQEQVVFGFDGAVLTIRCMGRVVAMPGEGKPWPKYYAIPAGRLQRLPKRLMSKWLEVSVWEGRLTIGSNFYAGVLIAESSEGVKNN